MHVLLVGDFYPPVPGGLEAHVRRLAGALDRRSHSVTVLASGDGSEVASDPWPVRRLATSVARVPERLRPSGRAFPPPWADPMLVRAIEEEVAATSPDVIHAHGWIALSALVAANRRRVPIVVTLHDYGLLCPLKSLYRGGAPCPLTSGARCVRCPGADQHVAVRLALAGALVRARRRVGGLRSIAVSSPVAERHRASMPGLSLRVIPNFLDDSAEWVPASPIGSSGPAPILFVGPEGAYKGFGVARAAMDLLWTRGWTGDLRHAGGTARVEQGQLRCLGRLSEVELLAEYEGASVVLLPVQWEDPCPTVALEAMRAGRAIIGSARGGLRDLVTAETGLLVEEPTPSGFAAALEFAFADHDRLREWGLAGRERFLQNYETGVVVDQVVEEYEAAIEGTA